MAKRTKAQRIAAAKASWERRRKGLPPLTKSRRKKASRRPRAVEFVYEPGPVMEQLAAATQPEKVYVTEPRIAYAVREGDDIFICFGHGRRLNREPVTDDAARKLLRELTAILV